MSTETSGYLAIIHGGHKLIGPQGKLRPLIKVHSAAHVVQVLEESHRHCSGTSNTDAKNAIKIEKKKGKKS